jgi:hypothetical protein
MTASLDHEQGACTRVLLVQGELAAAPTESCARAAVSAPAGEESIPPRPGGAESVVLPIRRDEELIGYLHNIRQDLRPCEMRHNTIITQLARLHSARNTWGLHGDNNSADARMRHVQDESCATVFTACICSPNPPAGRAQAGRHDAAPLAGKRAARKTAGAKTVGAARAAAHTPQHCSL